jgi:hypothetical protein
MITVTVTVPDTDQAAAVVAHLLCDGMMYMQLPMTIEITEEEDEDGKT